MTLSLCMIVKNEDEVLERCLTSILSVIDEIVIVDTGSTDQTLSIAKRLADTVIEIPWVDDFSYARNVSIDNAISDWILILDADHYICADSCTYIKESLRNQNTLAYMLPVRDHYDDTSTTITYMPLLFRNLSEIRYCGRIHEQVLPSICALLKQDSMWQVNLLANAVIEHYGNMSKGSSNSKKQRNLKLLEMSLREDPRNVYVRYKYSQILGFWSDDGYENLCEVVEQIFNMPDSERSMVGIGLEALCNASLCWLERNEIAKVIKASVLAELTYGTHPLLLYVKAYVAFELKDYETAIRLGMPAIEADAPFEYLSYDKDMLNDQVWLLIAYAYLKIDNIESCRNAIDNMNLHRQPSPRRYYSMMDDALSMEKPLIALRLAAKMLKRDCHNSECLEVCARAAEMVGDKSSALRWRSILRQKE